MRKEAVFLRIEHGLVAGKIEIGFFGVNLHLFLRQRGLQAVRGAFVIRAKYNRVVAFHVQAQFVIAVANLGKFLAYDRFENLIVGPSFGAQDFAAAAQCFTIDIQR